MTEIKTLKCCSRCGLIPQPGQRQYWFKALNEDNARKFCTPRCFGQAYPLKVNEQFQRHVAAIKKRRTDCEHWQVPHLNRDLEQVHGSHFDQFSYENFEAMPELESYVTPSKYREVSAQMW